MTKRAPLTDDDGEVRELTASDLRHFKPAADVMAAFKATGAGWQTRMNDALRDWLRTHPLA